MSRPTLGEIEQLQTRILAFMMQLDEYPVGSEKYEIGQRNINAMGDRLEKLVKAYGGEHE